MQLTLITIVLIILSLPFLAFGQTDQTDQKKLKKQERPLAKTIDAPEDLKLHNEVQSLIDQMNNELSQLTEIARAATTKTMAEKADLWSKLEACFLRLTIYAGNYNKFVELMGEKYNCKGCEVKVAPDKKTLVIMPKPIQ